MEENEKTSFNHRRFYLYSLVAILLVTFISVTALERSQNRSSEAASGGFGSVSITVSGKQWCLDNRFGNAVNGNKIQIEPCSGSDSQKWRYTSAGTLQNVNGYCVDTGAGAKAGTLMQLQQCDTIPGPTQLWHLDSNTLAVSNPATNLCLDIGRLVNSYPIKMWSCNKALTQQWTVSVIDPLASSPPMGFNNWYVTHANVTEQIILTQAQALVSTGLSKLGYNYVVIDDAWMASTRAADGSLQANPITFPHGIAWLADQVHALGLRLGVYEAYGPGTCVNHGALPGSYGHYQQDANTFASWGVDFVKFDNCLKPPAAQDTPTTLFPQMGAALQAANRRMVYSQELPVIVSTNILPQFTPYSSSNATQFATDVSISSTTSNMWRVAPDFHPSSLNATQGTSIEQVIKHLDNDLPLYKYAGGGHWNDLDMILAGNTAFDTSVSEGVAQMSIWAELASPLFISTDLTKITPQIMNILSNKAVIAVDQWGGQGRLVSTLNNAVDVISKPYPGGGYAVLLVNTSDTNQTVNFPVSVTGLNAQSATFTDLWSNTVTNVSTTFTQSLGPYATVMYRVQ